MIGPISGDDPPESDTGFTGDIANNNSDSDSDSDSSPLLKTTNKIPKDTFNIAYTIYFILGCAFLLPWNAFITAVDYFSYLYPAASVDRVFAVAYKPLGLFSLLFIVAYAHKPYSYIRVNVGLSLFVFSLLLVPVMDVLYIKGRTGLYDGFYVTVAAVAISGVGSGLVQGDILGAAGELPERYMQAVVAGTGASGVLISFLRIFTKAVYPQDAHGLRNSANLYFILSIVVMIVCIVFYNIVDRLPFIKYNKYLKIQAVNEEKEEKGVLTVALWRSALWDIVGRVKWCGFGVFIIYAVTLAIYPGCVTEDFHSQVLKDWYPILLITCYNVFDLVGKSLPALCLLENVKVTLGASLARLLLFPLFLGCLHGPEFFQTEIPVTLLTCLLGLTNGYFISVLMILAPKNVPLQHAEIAGTVMVLFLFVGLATGSVVAWFWDI